MQSMDPDVPQRPNKCHQETKTSPSPLLSLRWPQARTDPYQSTHRPHTYAAFILIFLCTRFLFSSYRRGKGAFISSVEKRTSSVLRLVSKLQNTVWSSVSVLESNRIYSHGDKAPAVQPRTRLLQARLPFVWYCLFFHRPFSSSDDAASSPPGHTPASHSCWYRSASIWKYGSIVRRNDLLLPASTYRELLRLLARGYFVVDQGWIHKIIDLYTIDEP